MTDQTHPAVREAAGALAGIVGWIGGSLAGLTALCYAAGYFVIHTHLTMLGFSGVVDVPADQLLLEGGRFFYYTLAKVLLAGMVIVLIPTGFYLLAKSVYRVPLIRDNKCVRWLRQILTSDRTKLIEGYALPLLAIFLVVLHFNYYYDELATLQTLNNLAFLTPGKGPGIAGEIAPMITSGSEVDRDNLIATYLQIVFNFTAFIASLWIVIHRAGATPLGKIAKTFFILYTALLAASLPLAFGVLVRTPIYPAATVILKNGEKFQGFLLQRSAEDILLWNPDARRNIAFDVADTSRVEAGDERDIFHKE